MKKSQHRGKRKFVVRMGVNKESGKKYVEFNFSVMPLTFPSPGKKLD